MSLLTVVVGIGMLLAAAGFVLGGPLMGVGLFFVAWVITLLGIIGYHLSNVIRGEDHTQFHFRAEHENEHGKPDARSGSQRE